MPDELRLPGLDPAILLDAEAEVVARTAVGDVATFAEQPPAIIRAIFLRHLLLELPATQDAAGSRPWPIRLPGVRIRGALIGGILDLAGCAGPNGAGLPALVLEACDIAEPIDLTNARLARLSLHESRVGEIRARGIRVDGPLDFSGVAPSDEVAWIDAHAAVIAGDLLGRGARLCAPQPRQGIAHRDARYALRLSGADIGGSIDLMGGVQAIGGISLDTAHVRGDAVMRGAHVTAGEGDAIGAQAGRFGGVVILADGFVAEGMIWLMGARISGTLDMNGARLANRAADGTGGTLTVDTAEIGGSVLLRNGFTSDGGVSLRGAKIGSSLECDGARLVNLTENGAGVALGADHVEIGGAVLLRHGFEAFGALSFIGAKIGGNVECDGGHLANATADGTGVALSAENAVIGGAVLLRHGFNAHGAISLLGATIDSNVECCGAVLENWSESGARETLRLTNVEISGDVLLNQGFLSHGYVSLWGTKIHRDLDCAAATFIGPSAVAARATAGALVATNLAVAGDVRLIGVTVLGRLDCEHLDVGGSLIWDGLRFPKQVDRAGTTHRYRPGIDAPARLRLSHARVGAAIVARDLMAEVAVSVDLSGARAGTLDDAGFPAGWGVGPAREGNYCLLDLEGFVYDRIGHLPPDEGSRLGTVVSALGRWASLSHIGRSASRALRLTLRLIHRRRTHVRQRLAWLELQNRKGSEFHPQPYRQLAKVLRAQGHYHAAREVAIAEQWAMPPSNWISRVLRPVWGICFGFGYSPVSATATLGLLLAIGTAGVWCAWTQANVLVINYSYAMTEVADGAVFRRASGPEATAAAPPCGKYDIQPLFYAMDMMLPVIALQQESKCGVDTRPGTEIWQFFWAAYSVLGKIVVSLALLTYSGVLKASDES